VVQKTLKIALDVDSVLADVIVTWLKVYQQLHSKHLKKADVNTWDFWKRLNLSRQQFEDIFTEAWNKWEQIPPTEEDLAGKVEKLRALGIVDIVTGRSRETIPYVKEWLNQHNIGYEKFVRVPLNSFKGHLAYEVFIDDSPHNVIDAAGKNRYSILYDQPWNQDVSLHPNIFRVRNLSEAVQVIKSLRF
jgi:5'(3')-deoxyribonucleotidase